MNNDKVLIQNGGYFIEFADLMIILFFISLTNFFRKKENITEKQDKTKKKQIDVNIPTPKPTEEVISKFNFKDTMTNIINIDQQRMNKLNNIYNSLNL